MSSTFHPSCMPFLVSQSVLVLFTFGASSAFFSVTSASKRCTHRLYYSHFFDPFSVTSSTRRRIRIIRTALFCSKRYHVKTSCIWPMSYSTLLVIFSIHPITRRHARPFMHIVPHKVCIAYSISFETAHSML